MLRTCLALSALALSSFASAQSMVVVRDAETGALRAPTAAEAQAMRAAEQQLKAKSIGEMGLVSRARIAGPVTREDGSVKITTPKISAGNHVGADGLLKYFAQLTGGSTKIEKRTGHAHVHAHEKATEDNKA